MPLARDQGVSVCLRSPVPLKQRKGQGHPSPACTGKPMDRPPWGLPTGLSSLRNSQHWLFMCRPFMGSAHVYHIICEAGDTTSDATLPGFFKERGVDRVTFVQVLAILASNRRAGHTCIPKFRSQNLFFRWVDHSR